MGIKHLWTVLNPFCERKPLYELQGKTVAVDLSCWICEAQNIAEYQVQPRMYLRNLYFRTCYLLLMQVNPVFVLEGEAPELKYDTITSRNAIQFKGAKPKTHGVKTGKGRSRFNFVLKQCEQMLKYMGLACLQSSGEAESLCAYLNEDGLVDGCISQDSDCFAYGARIVYRNFSISTQGAQAASGGAVDIYDITKAMENLDFGRNKIIAMALLVGSDYCEGVHGVGKDSVMKLFETVSETEVLDRIRSWRRKIRVYEELEKQISNKNICTSCGHEGKLQNHTKTGCISCGTLKGCDSFKFKEERTAIKNELNIRSKSLEDPDFPNENLIKEFLVRKDTVSKLNLKWKQPDVINFVKFTTQFLQWEEIYSFEKILPILSRWQCLNHEKQTLNAVLIPDRIKKARNPKGVPSYEIIWSDPNEFFKNLIPESQLLENNVDLEKLWTTIEPQNLVDKTYPDLVEKFRISKIKPKKPSKRKKKIDDIENLQNLVENISIHEPKQKKQRKKQNTIDNKQQTKTLDNFLKKAVINNHKQKNDISNVKIDKYASSTPVKQTSSEHVAQHSAIFDMEMSNFGDEDDLDVSDIVEGIIAKKLPDAIAEKLKKTPLEEKNDLNSSSFFVSGPVEEDFFEKTFNERFDVDDEEEEEEEYEKILDEEEEDSFCEEYVPLEERLRKRFH